MVTVLEGVLGYSSATQPPQPLGFELTSHFILRFPPRQRDAARNPISEALPELAHYPSAVDPLPSLSSCQVRF